MGLTFYQTNTPADSGTLFNISGCYSDTNNSLGNVYNYSLSTSGPNSGVTATHNFDSYPYCFFNFLYEFELGECPFLPELTQWDFALDAHTTLTGGVSVFAFTHARIVYVDYCGVGGGRQFYATCPLYYSTYPWGPRPLFSSPPYVTDPYLDMTVFPGNYPSSGTSVLVISHSFWRESGYTGGSCYIDVGGGSGGSISLIEGFTESASGGVVCGGVAEEDVVTLVGNRTFDIVLRNPTALDIYFKDLEPIIWYPCYPQGKEYLYDKIGTSHGLLTNFESYLTPWGALDDRLYIDIDPEVDLWEAGSLGTHAAIPYTSVWDFAFTQNFTITLWYSARTLAIPSLGEDHSCILNFGGTAVTTNFISLYDTGVMSPYFSYANGTTKVLDSGVSSTLDDWTHVACVVKNEFMGIYVNGVLENSRTDIISDYSYPDTTGNRTIGIWRTSNFRSYVGRLSDIKIYGLGLTEDQVGEIYNQELIQRSKRSSLDLLGDP